MVGPGTGIAPFRAFLLHSNRVDTKFELFFGCRREAEDFLFKEELHCLESTGRLSLLVTAFSREQRQKAYVQDKIASHHKELASVLDHDDARIYVAGAAGAMPKAVRRAFEEFLAAHLGISNTEAKERTRNMVAQRRYQEECW
mmetsp:Transcript_23252/g.33338  ORF Transcript_23252/g.33338 Transcript_23252/m.33338 type:complete len:143 (-) Transcript_23252:463-891(-)